MPEAPPGVPEEVTCAEDMPRSAPESAPQVTDAPPVPNLLSTSGSGAPLGTTLPAPAEPGGSVSGHSECGLSSRHSSMPMALSGPLPYAQMSATSACTSPRYRLSSMFHGQRRMNPLNAT